MTDIKYIDEDNMTKGAAEFIGTSFKTKYGNTLTVLGVINHKEFTDKHGYFKRVPIFTYHCDRCSPDEELYPEGEIKGRKGNIWSTKSSPCGCSDRVNWSKRQYLILCKRSCESKGHIFLGTEGDWNKGVTDIEVEIWNPATESRFKHTLQHVITKTYTDPAVKSQLLSDRMRRDDNELIERFFQTGAYIDGVIFSRNIDKTNCYGHKPYWDKWCPRCKTLTTTTSRLLVRGALSCDCVIRGRFSKFKDQLDREDHLYLYIMNDEFLKIGRAFTMNKRLNGIVHTSKIPRDKITLLKVYKDNHNNIYDIERALLAIMRYFKYGYYTEWTTESFNLECKEHLISVMDDLINSINKD